MKTNVFSATIILLVALSVPALLPGQAGTPDGGQPPTPAYSDPGVQPATFSCTAPPCAFPSVLKDDPPGIRSFFADSVKRFNIVETVPGTGTPPQNFGFGPRFNLNQCAGCHSFPGVGGSSPPQGNPQFTITIGTTDTRPSFVTANGPILEARFPFFMNSEGGISKTTNGGVEDLFTVTGLKGTGTCSIAQPPFAAAAKANNLVFRIPTPLFGLGLIENLDDSTLLSNVAGSQCGSSNSFGVCGSFNRNGNDGTITRFGWKAQNKSLLLFAGEAYNVEMGITNELFQNERPLPEEDLVDGLPATCLNLSLQGYPEDRTNYVPTFNANGDPQYPSIPSDIVQFANFMRFLSPLVPSTTTPGGANNITAGQTVFTSIGCASCHTPSIGPTQISSFGDISTTGVSDSSLSDATANAFSDFALHHMGGTLADNVMQGFASGDQFRTAPLWGVGQRAFLLHDGRTSNLVTAIRDHCIATDTDKSEACIPANTFFSSQITDTQRQQVLDFLRSL